MLSNFKTPFMEECPICLLPLSGSVTTVGCCRKQFHTGCIVKCTQDKNDCPMCRNKECIVYVPDPEPPTQFFIPVVEPEQRLEVRQRIIMCVSTGCILITIGYIVMRYHNGA